LCTTRNLRILAAGGDGTVTWILKTVRELGLDPAPAVAIMPLGTGNDLSLSFGWGNLFLERWIAASQASRRGGRGRQ
jgi:diacylglycerol kinase (ATP)